MQAITIRDRFFQTTYTFFKWRYSISLVNKLSLAFMMAAITGLMAQVRIYLPFSPVPVTGQVLAVLLSGVICGGVFGSISQMIYIGLGIAGIPWFAVTSHNCGYLLASPTFGYLIGFIVAPLIIGRYTDRYIAARTLFSQIKLMMSAVVIIYIFGAAYLALILKLTIWQALIQGVIPFIIFDVVKATLAALASSAILPRASYNGEIDKKE